MGEKYSDGNLLDVGFGIAGGDFDDEGGDEMSEIICERVETQDERRRRKRIAKTIRRNKRRRADGKIYSKINKKTALLNKRFCVQT